MHRFQNDLSQGSVVKQLLKFALPFVISNLIQSLYAVADMVIVGQFAGTVSMSGVNIGSQITLIVTNLVFGLSAGSTVLIGQYVGAGEKEPLKRTIGTLFTSLILLSAVLTVVLLIFNGGILRLVNTPPEAFSEASSYLRVTTIGIIFISGYNALSAVMRGMGDSKLPLVFVAIACVVNIGLDLLAVAVLKMGATGAATATIVSQAVSMLLCVLYLRKHGFMFDFRPSSFRVDKTQLKMLLMIGVPMSVQNVTVSISFTILTALVNTLGVVASAAVGAVGKFNAFGILPAMAMGAAVSAMSAQNFGAGKPERAVKTMWVGMIIAFIMSAAVFVMVMLAPEWVIRVFDDDPELVAAGAAYLQCYAYDYLVVPFLFCMNGLFIGAGHTTFSLINGCLSSILIRVPVAYVFGMALSMGLTGVGLGAPVASAVAIVVALVYFLTGKWRRTTIIKTQEQNT